MIARLIQKIRRAFAVAPVASTVFAVALIATVFFGARTVMFQYARPWIHGQDQPVAAWMTPRFIARSKDVPLDVIVETLAIERVYDGRPPTLEKIAEERGIPVQELIDAVEAEVRAFREGQQPAVRP